MTMCGEEILLFVFKGKQPFRALSCVSWAIPSVDFVFSVGNHSLLRDAGEGARAPITGSLEPRRPRRGVCNADFQSLNSTLRSRSARREN